MVIDPEFSDIRKYKYKSKARTGRSPVRWLIVYPLLGLSGCHMLLTGSPVPLWYIERLDRPVVVKAVTDNSLVLADGRNISLPFIKRLPRTDPVFLRALKHGVEVGQDGEVVGLIRVYRACGNDPYVWCTKRINLSDLAGCMNSECIDDSIVHPSEIQLLKESESGPLDRHGLPFVVMSKARHIREIYKAPESRVSTQPFLIRSFSREWVNQ